MWSRSAKPRAARAPYPGCPYSRGRSLPLRPPQAIVGPRPQLKERVDMARPRSVVDAVEGESRRPRIDLDWGTGQRHRHHLHETVLQRALRHAVSGKEVSPSAPGPHPPPLVRDASPRGRPRHPHAPGAAGAPRRQPTMIYTHVRNRRPATAGVRQTGCAAHELPGGLAGYMQRDRLQRPAAYPERRGSFRTGAKGGNQRAGLCSTR